jgi:ABC-2 type transport system permease protein
MGGSTFSAELYIDRAAWCLAYIALFVAATGFGLYLVGRRESGFVRAFLDSPARRGRFLVAQYLASMIMAMGYGLAFLAITAYTLTDIGMTPLLVLLAKYTMTVACFMFGAIFIAALPLTFRSASSIMSAFMTIAVVAGVASQAARAAPNPVLLYLNPFCAAAHFMTDAIAEAMVVPVLAAQVLMSAALGAYGLWRLRVNPEWRGR